MIRNIFLCFCCCPKTRRNINNIKSSTRSLARIVSYASFNILSIQNRLGIGIWIKFWRDACDLNADKYVSMAYRSIWIDSAFAIEILIFLSVHFYCYQKGQRILRWKLECRLRQSWRQQNKVAVLHALVSVVCFCSVDRYIRSIHAQLFDCSRLRAHSLISENVLILLLLSQFFRFLHSFCFVHLNAQIKHLYKVVFSRCTIFVRWLNGIWYDKVLKRFIQLTQAIWFHANYALCFWQVFFPIYRKRHFFKIESHESCDTIYAKLFVFASLTRKCVNHSFPAVNKPEWINQMEKHINIPTFSMGRFSP